VLSFTINPNLIQSLIELQAKFALNYNKLNSLGSDERDYIHRNVRISMIGASTRIENAILTDNEISWMDTILTQDGKTTAFQNQKQHIEAKFSKDRERSIEEVAGCRAMLSIIYEQAKDMLPLTESHIRGLHSELLRYYEKSNHYRGQYKKNSNSVAEVNHQTGTQKDVFKTADPGPITKVAMTDLVEWYNQAIGEEPWILGTAVEFVFRFLAIHPFQDGNGRLGRGLFLLSLLQCPNEHIAFVSRYLAIDRHIEKNKEEYYLVLQRCSDGKFKENPKKYRIEIFLQFMIKVLNQAFKDIEHYQKKFNLFINLAPSALTVLECFKDEPEMRLKTSDLVSKTGLPRRTVSNALESLHEAGFIQRYGQGPGVRYQIIF